MRELLTDNGSGTLYVQTDKLHIRLYSKARKNYHTTHSNWTLYCAFRGQYGYACTFHYEFGGTFDEALDRVETILLEIKETLLEIM